MATATCLGRDPLFLSSSSSSTSDRAVALKIRFADIIVKSSRNKSEALMKITREKEFLEKKQLEEKERMKIIEEERVALIKMKEEEEAMIEERKKIRQEERLALIKMEEEERSKSKFEQDSLCTEKELLNLCGGYRKARDRSLLKKFGLVLKTDVDDDLLYDLEEGEIF